MSEESLSDLLERSADRHAVAALPLERMLARSRAARTRRAGLMALAASVVVGSLIAGTTLLFSGNDSPQQRIADAPAPPSSGIVTLDGQWRLTAVRGAPGTPLGAGHRIVVRFSPGRMIETWSAGCNSVVTSYEQGGSGGRDLIFGEPDITGVACSSGEPLMNRLASVRHVSESKGALYLYDTNRAVVATLERLDASVPKPTRYPTAPPPGDPAVWRLAPNQDLSWFSTEFTAEVTRLSCHDGVTGEVLGPGVAYRGNQIVVTFTAARSPSREVFNCQGNDSVRIVVHLARPLGNSSLLDGECAEVSGTSPCAFDHGVRWSHSVK